MSLSHTALVVEDLFTTLSAEQLLYVDPNWVEWAENVNDLNFKEMPGESGVYADHHSWASGREQVCAWDGAAQPSAEDYTAWVEYGGELTRARDFYVGTAVRLADAGYTTWDGYVLFYRNNNDDNWQLRIYRFDNGGTTQLANYELGAALTPGDTYALEVSGTGASIGLKGYLNDSEVLSVTDSSGSRLVAAGKAGVASMTGGSPWVDPDASLLTFRIYEAAAGFIPYPYSRGARGGHFAMTGGLA